MQTRHSSLRGLAALVLTALTVVAGPAAAHAATPLPADPVAAVNSLIGTTPPGEDVVSAAYSPDHTRLSFRQAYPAPATAQSATEPAAGRAAQVNLTDLWTIRTDGNELSRLTDTEATAASYGGKISVTDAVWAPNSRGLAYVVVGPGHPTVLTTRVVSTSSADQDDWTGDHTYNHGGSWSGLTYTPDGHYLVARSVAFGSPTTTDYAVDLATSTEYFARSIDSTGTTWAPECATITEGSYTPPINSGNDVVDALAGDNPACKFGVTPEASTPATIAGPSGASGIKTLDDAPGITATTSRSLTPISEQLPSSALPGPVLRVTAVGKGLADARKKGLHVKYTLSRLATVKAWVILKDSGARYELPNAFAGVPASTVARGTEASSKPGAGSLYLKFGAKGKSALTGVSRVALQLKVTATDVAGRSTTVVQSVTLRR